MAISNANAVYSGQGPTETGQVLASGPSDQVEFAYKGIATLTLDGSATTATVNFIDGTKTLPFVPAAVIANTVGGTQQGATPVSAIVTSIANTGFSVKLSAAGTSANTLIIGFIALK